MSFVNDVTRNTIRLTGHDLNVTESITGDNLFVETKGTVQLKAKVDITNRAIIIGDFLAANPPLLTSRVVDIFKDTSEMLSKTQQYSEGAIEGRTVDDSVEILTRYIYLSEENLMQPIIVLSDLFEKMKVLPSLFEKLFFAIDFALRKDSKNPVLKAQVEKLFSSLLSQSGKGDLRAAELMKAAQKIGHTNYQDTPFWNQEYASFMSGIFKNVISSFGLTLNTALQVVEADYKRSPRDAQKKLALTSLYVAGAMEFHNTQQYQKAIEFAEKALKIDSEYEAAKIWLANCLNELSAQYLIAKKADKYQEVITAQERAIQLNPSFGRAYHNLAVALWLAHPDLSQIERVISLFEKNLTINPDDPITKSELVRAYDALGGLYMGGKRPGKSEIDAAGLMEKALILSPENTEVKSGLSVSCMLFAFKCQQNQFQGNTALIGETYLKRASEFSKCLNEELKKNLALICNQYAVAYTRGVISDRSHIDSINLLELAIALNPAFDQAKMSLYNLYTQYIEKCLEVASGDDSPFHMGEAIRCLKRAIELNPDDQECQDMLKMLSDNMFLASQMIFKEAESEGKSSESVIKEIVQSVFANIGIQYIETDTLATNLEKNIRALEDNLEISKNDQKLKPSLVSLYDFLAGLYSSQADPEQNCFEVLNLLERAHFLDPNEFGILAALGKYSAIAAILCHEEQVPGKNIGDGLKYLEKAIECKSSLQGNGGHSLAVACNLFAVSADAGLLSGKGVDFAIFLLKLAIELDQTLAMPYLNLGTIYLSQNQNIETFETAMTLFEESFYIDPQNEMVRKNLITTYHALASYYSRFPNERAFDTLSVLEKAHALDPDNDKFNHGLGCIYLTIAGHFMGKKYPEKPLSEGLDMFEECIRFQRFFDDSTLREVFGKLANNYAVACIDGIIKGKSMEFIVSLLKIAIVNNKALMRAHENLLTIYRDFPNTKSIVASVFPEYHKLLSELPESGKNPVEELMTRFSGLTL